MDKLLERYKLPKFTQKEIDNLNWPESIKETESVINKLSKQTALLRNSIEHLRRKLYQFSGISFRG